jgi:ABC-type multidrug transport system fused ATPase/permease subunit
MKPSAMKPSATRSGATKSGAKEPHAKEPQTKKDQARKDRAKKDRVREERAREERAVEDSAPTLRVIFRRFWPIMRRYRWQLALSSALVVVAPAIDTAQIWIFKLLIDDVLVPANFHAFVPIALAYLGFAVAQGVAGFCDELLATWLGERFVLDLRSQVFEHLNGLSLDFFDRRELGDTLSRLTGDIDSIEALLVSGVTRTLSYAVEILFFAGALFYLDWRLALSALVVAPVFLVAARYFSARIKTASREQRRRAGSITATAEEGLSNLALVQAYNNVRAQTARFDRENLGRFDAQMAATKLRALFTPLIDLLETLGALSVLGLGIWELTHDRITLGGLLVFIGYLTRLYSPVRGAGRLSNTLYAASARAERIIELLDEQPSVREATYPERLHRARGAIRVRGLGFGYPDGPRVLHDLTFAVQQGETVALVGPSGSGKSTLGKLLVRLYDPDEGSIVLDGHDLRAYRLTDLRANVALVLQEILVFDATVRDNILFGRAGATEEQLRDAAAAADALEFIEELPDGWETRVGQRGRLLSGGQRQRLALARAMIRDAPILLLDEPTTGLDAESTERVLAPMRRLMADRDRTTLVISHNLLTVTDADQIIYLDQGRITGRGTHDEMLRRHEGYARLYSLHRERPSVGASPSTGAVPPAAGPSAGAVLPAAVVPPAAAVPPAASPSTGAVPSGESLR